MRVLLTFCIIIIIGCSRTNKKLPAGLEYFPDVQLLQEGIVFKYYYHRGKKVAHPKTDILYRKMTLKDNLIINEDYNAGFLKTYHYEIEIVDGKWKLLSEKSFDYRSRSTEAMHEYPYIIKENIHTHWVEDSATQDKTVHYSTYGRRTLSLQKENLDSLTQDGKVKIFRGEKSYFTIVDGNEEETNTLTTYKRYEEGLGLTQSLMTNDELKFDLVLDEIMTLDEFERRANHGTHRVAYIDTLKTIDDHTLFKPCFHPTKINDYYNDKRSGFIGGKGRLRALLKEKLDPTKIQGESGYLTFRFVVNCKGQAGWFVTEEAGLDYEKKQFSEQCRTHLYNIIKAEKEWNNLNIRGEDCDAYTYLTFKIKDGEIIELLP